MEVGTKILIKKTCDGCRGAEGEVGIVTNKHSNNGLYDTTKGFNVELGKNNVWRINVDADVEILDNHFGKHLLHDGVIVKRKDGTYAVVIGDYTYSLGGHCSLNSYTENLTNKECVINALDIVAIYEPTGIGNIEQILDGQYLRLIAERSENVREMTLDEICKELGYNVKIIKEDK